MDKTLEELKAEADVLGIEYNKNIGAAKLSEKIEVYYESQAAGDSVKVQAEPEVKDYQPTKVDNTDKELTKREYIARAKAEAMKEFVVTVTNNDPRENSVLEADYFGFENQHFGKSLLVPFNVPVALPQGIIEVIESTFIIIHTDEYIDGRRTGNKVTKQTKKYNVSYGKVE